VYLGEIRGPIARPDVAVERRQLLKFPQNLDIAGVEFDGQLALLPGTSLQVPIRLQEAEHVRVLGGREVHELVSARLAVSHREASASLSVRPSVGTGIPVEGRRIDGVA
jgi:hypothetical protein